MGEVSEYDLDRHFTTQVRGIGEVYDGKIRCQDFDLSQLWLEVFQDAKSPAKYARNALMLLMCGQLREWGRLGKPFVDMENMRRPLDDVLNEYDGNMDADVETDPLETETDASISNGETRSESPDLVTGDPEAKEAGGDFECVKQANRELLKEIDSLCYRTLETEKLYVSRCHQLQKQLAKKTSGGKPEVLLQDRIWQAVIRAIDRLKDWSGDTQKIDFLATCFAPFLENEPAISGQIHELDRRLEVMLDEMVKQASERKYINMRIMYGCVYQHQKDCCKERRMELERSEQALREEKLKLRAYAEDLKRREEVLQRHEAIAAGMIKCPDPERLLLSTPGVPYCEKCENEKIAKRSRTCCHRKCAAKAKRVQDLAKFSDGPSDLSDGRKV